MRLQRHCRAALVLPRAAPRRGYLVTLNERRDGSWRGHCDAGRSSTLAHLGQCVGADLRAVWRPRTHPRWLPARLEHVLIHPWTPGLCCSPVIAESPRRRPPLSPITTGFRRSTCPSTPISRSSAKQPIRPPVTNRCLTTATCARWIRG